MELTINSTTSWQGTTWGCIYTRESNGADPEVNYTYRFAYGMLLDVQVWVGNECVAQDKV